MNPAHPYPDVHCGKDRPPRGFALVATLMLMILLAVVAVGLLSLSSVSLRTSGQASAAAEARANARLGLMMAIGQLQRISGQDQRVTATANIIDQAANGKRHWTGVWSTEKWDVTKPNEREFIGWLVSDSQLDPANPLTEAAAKQPVVSGGAVTLVGSGSAGNTPENEVKARLVAVSRSGGQTGGAYAYWVGDQGVKASYGITGQGAQDDWSDAARLATMKRVGIESSQITALEKYAQLTGEQLLKGASSALSMDALHGRGTAQQVFHDYAPRSLSLLTDTRLGGFARDLSTAFELPDAEFNAIAEFHGSGERNTTNGYAALGGTYTDPKFYGDGETSNIGYLAEITNGSSIFRGPTWDLLRNHYRLYKRDWDTSTSWARSYSPIGNQSFMSRGFLPHSYSKTYSGPGAVSPFLYHPGIAAFYGRAIRGGFRDINYLDKPRNGFDPNIREGMIHARSPRLMPIVSRITLGFSILQMPVPSVQDWSLGISFDPYVTLVNPYNVPISFQSIGLFTAKINSFGGRIRFTDRATNMPREAPLSDYFSQNFYNQGSFMFRIPPPAGAAAWVLQPGEVKVISPVKLSRQDIIRFNINRVRGQFEYSEDSGLYYFYSSNNKWQVKPKEGTTVELEFTGNDGNEQDMFTVHLHYAKDHAGAARDVFNHVPPRNMFSENDSFDDPHITKIGYARGNYGPDGPIQVRRSLNTNQIPRMASGPQAIAAIDIRMKTARGDTPLFWLNPRGQAFDTRDYDGGQRTSPLFDSRVMPIGDLSELQMVANPSGNGYWGDSHTAMNGSTRVVLYEVPQVPLTSPAQLQHADFSATGSGGSLLLGNSFAHPGIAYLDSIITRRKGVPNAYSDYSEFQTLADMAWAGNEMLWDRYFFSGMNWGASNLPLTGASQAYATQDAAVDALLAADPKAKYPLMNPRMVLVDPAHSSTARSELKDYAKIAAHLAVEGGFNVNSTSERAWRAMFSALRAATISYAENGSVRTQQADNAFSRFTIPTAKASNLWEGGFHNLSDQQIEDLAEAMVGQVRERGPFMGLADFVNRRLDNGTGAAGTDVGVLGALQAAIEKAGLNDRPEVSNPTTAGNMEHRNYTVAGTQKRFSTYVGTPGYVMQADILSALGSNLRARSDTFVIRAYGESRDATGKVLARAWCEASVQRTPHWLVPTDAEPAITDPTYSGANPKGDVVVRPWAANPAFPETAKNFGRAYRLVAFRWLAPSEI
jgi:type II secretory pathway pseudopilin PulG